MRELPAFYHPLDFKVAKVPVIVYPARSRQMDDASNSFAFTEQALKQHIRALHRLHGCLRQGTFQVVFLWSQKTTPMADVWVFDESAGEVYEASGALIRAYIFRGLDPCGQEEGLASSVTMPVLGAEAALRRDIVDLERFVHSPDIYPAIPGLPLTPRYGES